MRLKVFASKPLWGVVGMLKKYVAKFAMDILPSVAATIIGAYIVNHYIVTKPGAGAPVTAAVSTAEPSPEAKAPGKTASKPSERSSDLANLPEAGVKAKGIAEKSILDKPTSEKPADKSADKPSETASLPVEARRHQPASREKTASKPMSPPVQSSASQLSTSAMVPVVAAPNTAPPAEVSVVPDANDLARAAIERLRGANDGSSRAQEAARIPDASRIPDAPHVVSASPVSAPLAAPLMGLPPVRPLPPPIMVSTPSGETLDPTGSSQMKPPYVAARVDDPSRPTPPADIPSSPSSRPLDLHAEASGPSAREHTNVAEEVLSAAKSVFHAVLPNSSSK
jgi:hypothetical protein